MTFGLDISDAYGQPVMSASTGSFVFGGSTKHTGVEKVTVGATRSYLGTLNGQSGAGGFIDFRIDDTSIDNTDDAASTAAILPFTTGPIPTAVTHIYKSIKSGAVNAWYVGSTFVANAGGGTSSMTVGVQWGIGSVGQGDQFIGGLVLRGDPGNASNPLLANAGTVTMSKRNRMIPQLCVGDQFQFGPTANLQVVGYNTIGQEAITYQGLGDVYTVQSITYISAYRWTVNFTPPRASAPSTAATLYVSSNLSKIFVRAALQIKADNTASYIPDNTFHMYYFRKIRSSDSVGASFGMHAYDESGALTFTTNRRLLELSALGIISAYNNSNAYDPLTGDWITGDYLFGQTPTNFATYSPVVGRCLMNWNSSLTTGSGYIKIYSQGSGYGSSMGVSVAARPVPGTSQYKICKVGAQVFGATTYNGTPLPNTLNIASNSSVMVIDTSKYQP